MDDLDRLAELDGLLALATTAPLSATDCARVVALTEAAPGRKRKVVNALSHQRDAAAIDALLTLPAKTPGVVEAVFGALRDGVTREIDGRPCPRMLALEFRASRSKRFPELLAHAEAGFGARLERLELGAQLHYRVSLFEDPPERARLRRDARAVELDLIHLHRDLARLKGTRLWLNGWCFEDGSALGPSRRGPLLRAWLDWALSSDAETREPIEPADGIRDAIG